MGIEIERKFLVKDNSYKNGSEVYLFKQGYLLADRDKTVRVRVTGEMGFITVKSKVIGMTRHEFEYEIPAEEANEMLNMLCIKPIIEKHRYIKDYKGFKWEIDEFHGDNEGLVVAEIELENENVDFPLPEWVGEEVTGITKYYNSSLVKNPFKNWG